MQESNSSLSCRGPWYVVQDWRIYSSRLARFHNGILTLVSEIPLVMSVRCAVLSDFPSLAAVQCFFELLGLQSYSAPGCLRCPVFTRTALRGLPPSLQYRWNAGEALLSSQVCLTILAQCASVLGIQWSYYFSEVQGEEASYRLWNDLENMENATLAWVHNPERPFPSSPSAAGLRAVLFLLCPVWSFALSVVFQDVLEKKGGSFPMYHHGQQSEFGGHHPPGWHRVGKAGMGQPMSWKPSRDVHGLGDKPTCPRGRGCFLHDSFLYMCAHIFLGGKVNLQKEVFTQVFAVLSNEFSLGFRAKW